MKRIDNKNPATQTFGKRDIRFNQKVAKVLNHYFFISRPQTHTHTFMPVCSLSRERQQSPTPPVCLSSDMSAPHSVFIRLTSAPMENNILCKWAAWYPISQWGVSSLIELFSFSHCRSSPFLSFIGQSSHPQSARLLFINSLGRFPQQDNDLICLQNSSRCSEIFLYGVIRRDTG